MSKNVRTPRVVSVEPREGYTLWLRFENGAEGLLDMTKDVERDWDLIKPLRDVDVFRRAQIGNEHEDGLLWPDVYDDPVNSYYGAWNADGLYYRVVVSGDCTRTDSSIPLDVVCRRIRESLAQSSQAPKSRVRPPRVALGEVTVKGKKGLRRNKRGHGRLRSKAS